MYRVIYQLSCPHVSSTDTNPGKIQASQAKEDKAKAVAALSGFGSGMFDRLRGAASGGRDSSSPSESSSIASQGGPLQDATRGTAAPAATVPPSASTSAWSPQIVSHALAGSTDDDDNSASTSWPESLNLGHMYCLDKQAFLQGPGGGGRYVSGSTRIIMSLSI